MMNKTRALISIFFVALSAFACAGINWRTDLAAAMKEGKSTRKLVMVYYYAEYSEWCKQMENFTLKNKSVTAASLKVIPVRINVEDDESRLLKKHKLKGYPTLLFLDENESKFGELFGFITPQLLSDEIDKFVSAHQQWPSIWEAYKKSPNNGEVNAKLSWAYAIRREQDKAISHIQRSERAGYTGLYVARAYNMIGDTFQLGDDYEEAIAYFKKAATKTKDAAILSYSYVSLVSCYHSLQNKAEMKRWSNQLFELKGAIPEYVQFAKDLLKRAEESLATTKSGKRLDP